MVPSLRLSQSVALPLALVCPRTGRRYRPPSLPTYTNALPLAVPTATECWSECVVFGQVFLLSSALQHGKLKFQYGPTTCQFEPPLVVSLTSSRPAHTWFGSAGSTSRNWLYQAWMPGP